MTDQREDASYDAYLLHVPDGSWLAQLADMPGAYALGASQAEAVARLTAAIPRYYAWLRRHDEYTPITHDAPHVVVRETAEAGAAPVNGAYFSGDAEPVSEEDLDWWLAALEWATSDLVEQVRRMPVDQFRDALLAALAQTQGQIVTSALGQALTVAPVADALTMVKTVGAATVAAFRRSNAEQRAATREAAGERWTLRRGLRESVLLARRATETLAAQGGRS